MIESAKRGDRCMLERVETPGFSDKVLVTRTGRSPKSRCRSDFVWYRRWWDTRLGVSDGKHSHRMLMSTFLQRAVPLPPTQKDVDQDAANDAAVADAASDAASVAASAARAMAIAERTLERILEHDKHPGKSPQSVAIQLDDALRRRIQLSLNMLARF